MTGKELQEAAEIQVGGLRQIKKDLSLCVWIGAADIQLLCLSASVQDTSVLKCRCKTDEVQRRLSTARPRFTY